MLTNYHFFIFITLLEYVSSMCPNLCNANGVCSSDSVCTCFSGYTGAECNLRTCPYGTAWADKAFSKETGHQDAECSGVGTCNRENGVCECHEGFTGLACERATCPNECNYRGTCLTMAEVATFYGKDYDPTIKNAGDGLGPTYANWDKDSVTLCNCDHGYFGPDCSQVMCPKGDDPVTDSQNYRQIKLAVSDMGTMNGTLGITFQGETSFVSLVAPSSSDCETSLESSEKFGDVTCVYAEVGNDLLSEIEFDITFVSWPKLPKENNLYTHNGNPFISEFTCDISRTDPTTLCTFTNIEDTYLREYAYCSNRGSCDFKTGTCSCIDGFGGLACERIDYIYSHTTDTGVAEQVTVRTPDYNSTAYRISAARSSDPDYYLLETFSDSKQSFYVRGDGEVGALKARVWSSGMTVDKGGLTVEYGGFNVPGDGAYFYNTDVTSPALSVHSTSEGFTGDALRVSSTATKTTTHNLIRGYTAGTAQFSVRGDGLVNIGDVGMYVTGGVSIMNDGLFVSDGVTVYDSGMKVTGGMTVVGAATITEGLTVRSPGMRVTGGMTVNDRVMIETGGLLVTAGGQTITAGGMAIVDGATIAAAGLTITGSLSVNSDGFKVTNGVSINDLGLVASGGLTVSSDGMKVTGGLSISHGVKMTGGLTVSDTGVTITNGATIVDTGLTVDAAGMSILSSGMGVVGGATVTTGGLYVSANGADITGGATVHTAGMKVIGGLTVHNTGLYVTGGGATIGAGGLKVTSGATIGDGGLTVESSGIVATGGMTLYDVGMKVTGGITVRNTGLMVTADGGSIRLGGMKVAGGLTVSDTGLFVTGGVQSTGGVTIHDLGLKVTGGVSVMNTGLVVSSNGASIAGNGLKVEGGVTVANTGLSASVNGMAVTGGLSVRNSGLKVTGGVTITGGLYMSTEGTTISADGLSVVGGMTASNSQLRVDAAGLESTGGLSIYEGGASFSSGVGITVLDTGLEVTSVGATVVADGMKITGGVSVTSSGLTVDAGGVQSTGGLTINSGGVDLASGASLTVNNGGVVVVGGVTVSGGFKVTGGVTVTTGNVVAGSHVQTSGSISVYGGASVTGGITVGTGGLKVDNGGATLNGNVQLNGAMTVTGDVHCQTNTPSDRRLKTNISPLKNSLSEITKLRGVYFKWNENSPAYNNSKARDQRQLGLIAQEVEAVYPELVYDIMDGDYKGVNYVSLIPIMVEAIRDLNSKYLDLNAFSLDLDESTQPCKKGV